MPADPQDVREHYEERAALIEFDGGRPRRQAEAAARRETAAQYGLTVREVWAICAAKGGKADG